MRFVALLLALSCASVFAGSPKVAAGPHPLNTLTMREDGTIVSFPGNEAITFVGIKGKGIIPVGCKVPTVAEIEGASMTWMANILREYFAKVPGRFLPIALVCGTADERLDFPFSGESYYDSVEQAGAPLEMIYSQKSKNKKVGYVAWISSKLLIVIFEKH